MPRTAAGDTAKLMVEISTEENAKINDYLKAKSSRYMRKVSKIEAATDVMRFGIENVETQIESLQEELSNFKNQK